MKAPVARYAARFRATVGVLVGLAGFTPLAWGVDSLLALPLEQLLEVEITGASRFAQSSREAPSAVTVVTREQIRDHAWPTLAAILDSVPGLFVTTDRVYSYLGVRGFQQPSDYNTNVLLLIDGIPANEAVYNQAFLGSAALVDVGLIERVEFIPGPGSSVYGGNAILGVINVITTTGRALRGTTVETGMASHGGRDVAVRYGFADDQRETLLSASTWHSDGESVRFSEPHNASSGRAHDMERERGHRLLARHAWDKFTFFAAHSERSAGYSTAPYETAVGDPRTRARDAQWLLALSHEAEWQSGLTVLSRASFGGAEYQGTWAYEADSVNRDAGDSRWWGLELQGTDTRLANHTLVYGFEYRDQYRLYQRNADIVPAPTEVWFEDQRSAHYLGAYVQDEWRGDNWRINAGVRLDQYSSFGNTIHPRLGFIHAFSPSTTFKYLFGSAYRAPSVFEMYYHDDNETMKANPDLRPERVRSLEWVVEHRTAQAWEWRASVSQNRIRNLIAQDLDSDELLVYRNRGKANIHGVEVGVRREWRDGTRVAVSSSWHDARDGDTDARLTHSPRQLAKLDVTLPFGAWRTTLEARHVGARKTLAGRLGSQTWSNFILASAAPVIGGAKVSLRIDNLFDRKLADPASEEFDQDRLPRPGRSARVVASWQY